MCDQSLPYTPGTRVWVKVYNRIWWPGKVINPKYIPEELQDYISKKKNLIAVVHFSRDDTYEVVTNMDKVFLYSCSKKIEFLKKGYSLYEREKKGTKIQNVNMALFLDDVKSFEKEIVDGNEDIFEQFKDNDERPKINIKELFVSSKDKKKKTPQKRQSEKSSPSLEPSARKNKEANERTKRARARLARAK